MGERPETFEGGQCRVLERVAAGAPLPELLEAIVRLIEGQAAGMVCSILLLDAERDCVRQGAAPSLPPEYSRLLDGLAIGPEAGSCGAAAYRRERVIVEDIATHPYWEKYRALALPHGLRACWSSPIFSPEREVLGTFAMYYREPRKPRDEEITWVDAATHLASIAILRDRRDRERARLLAEIRRSEERLRGVIENTPNVSLQWYDEQGRIFYYNKASERLFGWTSTSALGKTLFEIGFFTAEEETRFANLRAAAASGHPSDPVEFVYRRPDGTNGYLFSTVFSIPSADTVSGYCSVCTDVELTDYRRIQDEMRANERIQALVYNAVEDVIFYLGVEGADQYRFLSVNPAFLRATGLTEADVVGKRVDEVIPPESRALVFGKYAEAIETGRTVRWDEVSQYPTGTKHGEVTISPILDVNGRCVRLIGTVHDITDRHRAEEERRTFEARLQRGERLEALGTLAGGIAHDFNNLIAAISCNADLAMTALPEDAPVRDNVLDIRSATRRATDLVRRVLTFSGHPESKREPMALQPIVEETLRLLGATLPPNVRVEARFASDLPPVSADATQIHQVLMNLGTNAGHALRNGGGRIRVTVDERVVASAPDGGPPDLREGRYVCVAVADDGCGMDAATLARAFDPFFTTRGLGQGTGLGLSVVHGIVKDHGGTLTVESEVGRGTTFRLYFPAVELQEDAVAPPRAEPSRGVRVLFVDDQKALVLLAARALGRLDHRVTGHTDSTRALQDFRTHPEDFDVVVTDMSMPGLSGIDLVREIRRIRPDIPIVMTSGFARQEDVERARELGVERILPKPTSVSDFAEVLSRAIMPAGT